MQLSCDPGGTFDENFWSRSACWMAGSLLVGGLVLRISPFFQPVFRGIECCICVVDSGSSTFDFGVQAASTVQSGDGSIQN